MKTKLISLVLAVLMVAGIIAAVPSASAKSTATVNGTSVNVGDKVTVTYYAKSTDLWEDFQGAVSYDKAGLQFESFAMPNITAGMKGFNSGEAGIVRYSGSNLDLYDFTTEKVMFKLEFTVIASGDYNVTNNWDAIDNEMSKPIANNGVCDEKKLSFRMNITSEAVEGNCSVSYYLSEVTSSNTTELVKKGDAYTTTLTPTEGYEIKTLVCTNGDSVLPYTVSGDSYVLSTDKVEGDIVITVVATKKAEPSTTESTTESTTASTTESTTESTTASTTESTTESTAASTTESTTESTAASTTESTTESTTASTTESTTESTTASTTESTTESTAASTTESTTESTAASTTESTTESTTASTTESTTVSTTETTTEPITTITSPVPTVKPVVKVTSVKLNATSKVLNKGRSFILKATVAPSNAANKAVSWSSTNKQVATVTQAGVVVAKKKGVAYIKATAKDGSKKSAQCKVTVKQPVTKVTVSVKSKTLKFNKSFNIKATVAPSNANNKNVGWTLNKKGIVKISKTTSASGKAIKVTALKKAGTVVLKATAKDGSKKYASCKIVVKKK